MDFIFEQMLMGGDKNFGYLYGDREKGECLIIDPSYAPSLLIDRAKAQGLNVVAIVNTHGHHDHINGNEEAAALTGAKILAHENSAHHVDSSIDHNDLISAGKFSLKALFTPGHSPDHLVLYDQENGIAITGDLLFVGRVGKTFDDDTSKEEWNSLNRLISELPETTTIWPGHDYGCRPSSTVLLERRTNPFILCEDLDAFLSLKEKWPRFQKKMGYR